MKLNEVKQKIDDFFNNLSEDEIEKLKEKYFPKESNTPKGWVSIDERLPMLKAVDLFEGGTEYKVLFEDGVESYTKRNKTNRVMKRIIETSKGKFLVVEAIDNASIHTGFKLSEITEEEAVEMILKYIPKEVKTIWECTAIKESKIVKVLKDAGYNVITSHIEDGQDFFKYEPENYDMIITNPPYSLKDKFLKRAYDLKKPFMFLLPLTTLEGIERGKMFDKNGIQMLIPNKRFNFKPEKNSGAWFQTSWFRFRCGLSSDLNFVSLK